MARNKIADEHAKRYPAHTYVYTSRLDNILFEIRLIAFDDQAADLMAGQLGTRFGVMLTLVGKHSL